MVDTDTPLIEFSVEDRCDRCGAQAYSLARKHDAASELLMCLHHRREYADNMMDEGWEIVDDYEAIERLFPDYNLVAV